MTEGHLEWRPQHRRALLVLSEQAIEGLVALPHGWSVLGVHADFVTTSIHVLVTGPEAPITEPGTEPPRTPAYITKQGRVVFHYDELPGYGQSEWTDLGATDQGSASDDEGTYDPATGKRLKSWAEINAEQDAEAQGIYDPHARHHDLPHTYDPHPSEPPTPPEPPPSDPPPPRTPHPSPRYLGSEAGCYG